MGKSTNGFLEKIFDFMKQKMMSLEQYLVMMLSTSSKAFLIVEVSKIEEKVKEKIHKCYNDKTLLQKDGIVSLDS